MAALGGRQLGFFAPRFLSYRAAIHRKYILLHGFVDPKFINTALFSDDTQRQHNRDRRTNFSGHKNFYCYGYLNTVAPDGMIVDISGAFAGRNNDHIKRNENHLSDRLVDCQVDNAIQCNTMTDKGLYRKKVSSSKYYISYKMFNLQAFISNHALFQSTTMLSIRLLKTSLTTAAHRLE